MSFVAAAVVGSAVIGGVVTAKVASNASNKAAAVSQSTTAENNALARDIYAQNTATLSPFVAQGGAATSYINQLLGIKTAPAVQPASSAGMASSFGGINPDNAGGSFAYNTGSDFTFSGNGRDPNMAYAQRITQGQPQPQPGGAPQLAPGEAANAFDAYRNSTGYQFRLGEGTRAITNNKAVSGLLNSGSALKALTKYGQDYGSNEFSNYLGQLTGQQGVGLSAASAQAGVANNYSANVQGNNSTNATNQGNAAIASANATANAIQGVVGTAGYLAGRKL